MDEATHDKLVKSIGDACGGLASGSVGFAIFVITLSAMVLYYKIEMWSIVSVMIGIALTCILVRLSLFLSNFKEHNPEDMVRPVLAWIVGFAVLGVVAGCVVSDSLNKPFPNEMCYEILNGKVEGHSNEAIQGCFVYRDNIHLLLNITLASYVILMVVWLVGRITYETSRFGCIK